MRATIVAALVVAAVACSSDPPPPAAPSPTALGAAVPLPDDPRRQFDFWLGEWGVRNKLLVDGQWLNRGTAIARVRPVCDGAAVFEQWTGTLNGDTLTGMSLRAYDPERNAWAIWLNRHGGSPDGFSVMHGTRNGERIEQFPPGDTPTTRSTFSNAHENSCQWDAASLEDDEWRHSWVMHFTRHDAAAPLDASNVPIVDAPPSAAAHEQTQALSWLIGSWTGDAGVNAAVSSMIDGFALMQLVDEDDGARSFVATGWDRSENGWVALRVDNRRPGIRRSVGRVDADRAEFVYEDGANRLRERWRRLDGGVAFERAVSEDGGASWRTVVTTEMGPQ